MSFPLSLTSTKHLLFPVCLEHWSSVLTNQLWILVLLLACFAYVENLCFLKDFWLDFYTDLFMNTTFYNALILVSGTSPGPHPCHLLCKMRKKAQITNPSCLFCQWQPCLLFLEQIGAAWLRSKDVSVDAAHIPGTTNPGQTRIWWALRTLETSEMCMHKSKW